MENLVGIAGVLVTLVSMVVSLLQAAKARKYSEKARQFMHLAQMSSILERLNIAQELVRDIEPRESVSAIYIREGITRLRPHFDFAIGYLPETPGGAKSELRRAQEALNKYVDSIDKESPNSFHWRNITSHLQEAVSLVNRNLFCKL